MPVIITALGGWVIGFIAWRPSTAEEWIITLLFGICLAALVGFSNLVNKSLRDW